MDKVYKRFYFFSLTVLLILSVYPLMNGIRMAVISIQNGAVEPAQYARYVVPYAAMSLAVILFTALQPLLFKLKRLVLPVGLIGAFSIFIAAEQFFEKIQIHTVGMSLVNTSTLEPDPNITATTIDIWQASLCVASPKMLGQTVTYASSDSYLYVLGNGSYKIHYYLIAIVLITMVCWLVYGIGCMLRTHDKTRSKPLIIQGISTAVLLALCIFANTTAFFRQPGYIQSPLASLLTGLFFVLLGTTVGLYIGSFFLDRNSRIGIAIPVLSALLSVSLMYIGESVMMEGSLYRFGTGWFFTGLSDIKGIPETLGFLLAPVDLLIILLSALLTGLLVGLARRNKGWPGKRTAIVSVIVCTIIAITGVAFSLSPKPPSDSHENDLMGCYEYSDCLFMNPLSSFMPLTKSDMPLIYGFKEKGLIIADQVTGDVQRFDARYEKTPAGEDEFQSIADFPSFDQTDLSRYQERWLRGVFTGDGRQYGLYQMDSEIWLVNLAGDRLWSIYRLQKTVSTSLDDLEQAWQTQNDNRDKPQMTLADVYDLARLGSELAVSDFEPFAGKRVGSDFSILRFDLAASSSTVIVRTSQPDNSLQAVRLVKQGYDPFDDSITIDLRDGATAVAAYMNPLHSLASIKIEDPHQGSEARELIYTDDHNGYRYYLNITRADQITVTFANGEKLPLKQALAARRLLIEDAVAHGLGNVYMEPIENPMDGFFPILHHQHIFGFDKEEFYPTSSFMYFVKGSYEVYFDINELADILRWQGREPIAEKLLGYANSDQLVMIAGKSYISSDGLKENGITCDIGWSVSFATPVWFSQDVG